MFLNKILIILNKTIHFNKIAWFISSLALDTSFIISLSTVSKVEDCVGDGVGDDVGDDVGDKDDDVGENVWKIGLIFGDSDSVIPFVFKIEENPIIDNMIDLYFIFICYQ